MVLGLGRFGKSLALELMAQGAEVLGLDADEAVVQRVASRLTHAAVADTTDEESLRQLSVQDFDRAVVGIGSDLEASLLTASALITMGVTNVWAKAISNAHAKILSQIGVHHVVRPEHDMGKRLGHQLASPSIVDAFSLGEVHGVVEVEAGEKLVGRLDELRLPNRFGVTVIAVNRGGEVSISPSAAYELRQGDHLVVIGGNAAIDKLRKYLAD